MTADPVALDPRARPARGLGVPGGSAAVATLLLLLALAGASAGATVGVGATADSLATAAGAAPGGAVPAVAAPDSAGSGAATAAPDSAAAAGSVLTGRPGAAPGSSAPGGSAPGGSAPGGAPTDAAAPAIDLWDTGVDATKAVLATPLFPGWGQLYADGGWRAALAFGAEMYFWSNLLARDRQARRDRDDADTLPVGDARRTFAEQLETEHRAQVRDFAWWSGGALLIIALDAYVGAHLFDFGHDPVPVPDRWNDAFGPVGELPGGGGGGPEVTVFQWRTGF